MWNFILSLREEAIGFVFGVVAGPILKYFLDKLNIRFKSDVDKESELDIHKKKAKFDKRSEVLDQLFPLINSTFREYMNIVGWISDPPYEPKSYSENEEYLKKIEASIKDAHYSHGMVSQLLDDNMHYFSENEEELITNILISFHLCFTWSASFIHACRLRKYKDIDRHSKICRENLEVHIAESDKYILQLTDSIRGSTT